MGIRKSTTPIAHFESFAEGRGWNASFGEPTEQRSVYALDEVIRLLRRAEAAVSDGSWVAVALSYEAAPAFDSALTVKPSSEFPLAWIAVFDEPTPADFNSISSRQLPIAEWEPQIDKRQ